MPNDRGFFLLGTNGLLIASRDREVQPGGTMKTKITTSRNSILRAAAVASLSAASFVLMGACQSYEDPSEATAMEEASPLEAIGGDVDVDTENVDVAEEALMAATAPCDVRCCNGSLYHGVTANQNTCITYARSLCGVGHSRRIKFAGVYIFARPC
jgi:hypothetical protein